MKSPITPLLLLTLLATTTTLTSATDLTAAYTSCTARSASVAAAIRGLCARTDIVTGTTHQRDVYFLNDKATVRIQPPSDSNTGGCSPPAWVPSYWCAEQFLQICNAHPKGFGSKQFGKGGCQEFVIEKTSTF